MRQRLTLSKSDYRISENGCVLQAGGLKIKAIDEVPKQEAKNITCLKLAHNQITKIQNMKQFAALQQFDFSHNSIKNGLQLIKLSQLNKLAKVIVSGNPFLLDPLHEEVLEFLIERQTDIQILSGEALNRMRDLHEGELKVVFLQNYLKKMSCHQEIMSKKFGRAPSSRSLITEQNANKHIITKIMPQFYSIIDDPRLNSKLKKQTLGLKRKQQLSFEEAMKKKKEKQQKQVDNLIKDILILVEQQDEQHYQSPKEPRQQDFTQQQEHQMFPQVNFEQQKSAKKRAGSISKSKAETKKMQPQLDNQPNSSLKRKFNRIQNKIKIEEIENQVYIPRRQQKYFISPKRQSPQRSEKLLKRFQNYNIKVFSPQEEKLISMTNEKIENETPSKNQSTHFYSFNKTTQIHPNRGTNQQQKSDNKESNRKLNTPKMSEFQSPKAEDDYFIESSQRKSAVNDRLMIETHLDFNALTANTSPSTLYQLYYSHLTKYNPSFALLYSDIATLSSQEKSVLIEALAKDHKEKTLELFRQQAKFKKLKQVSLENINNYEKQIQIMQSQLDDYSENEGLIKQYGHQIEQQNCKQAEHIKHLVNDLKKLKEQNWQHHQQNLNKMTLIKTLEADIKQKKEELTKLHNYEIHFQTIKAKADKRRKKETLKIIEFRAKQYAHVSVWKSRRQQKQRGKLLNISWSLLKKHLLTQVLAKMKAEQKNVTLLKKCFEDWKEDIEQDKIRKQLSKKIKVMLQLKNLKMFKKINTQRLSRKKQIKLHQFWADRQYLKAWFYKLNNRCQYLKQLNEKKMKNAQKHQQKYLLSQVLKNLKKIVKIRKQNEQIIQKNKNKGNKSNFFQRLRKLYRSRLIVQERMNKIQTVGLILRMQIQNKLKIKAVKNIMKQNQEVIRKCSQISILRKKDILFSILNKTKRSKQIQRQQIDLKCKLKQLYYKRFIRKGKSVLRFGVNIKKFFQKYLKYNFHNEGVVESKCDVIKDKIRSHRIKQVYRSLTRNMYTKKLFNIEVQQRVQSQQTQQLFQKMKMIESMQIEAIKNEHIKQLQIIQEQEIQKQLNYRSTLAITENDRKELQDVIKLMKSELQGFRGRQGVFLKQKSIMEEQIKLAEQGREQLIMLNEKLRSQIANINTKYDRMLEIYTQAVMDLERKEKQHYQSGEKQRNDRTVEKDKRQTGVTKNGEFVSLRSRVF